MHNCQLSPNQPRRAHHPARPRAAASTAAGPWEEDLTHRGAPEASDDVQHPRDVRKIYLQVLESSEVKLGKTYLTSSTLQLPFKGKWLAMSPHKVTTYCCVPDTLKEQDRMQPDGMQPDEEQTLICKSRLSFQILTNAVCFWLHAFLPPQGT